MYWPGSASGRRSRSEGGRARVLNHRLPWLRWLSVVGFPLAIRIAWSPPANADKSGTRPNVISVPRGPGSIEGLGESFQVNLNSGSVTESVPLTLPPGTAGFAPQLSLVYDSGGGNGPLGIGWSLPIPTIQVQTEKGLPRYDGSDRFLYQGGELVPISDGVYRLKNEGAFVRVRRSGQGWEVDLPSGVTQQFGKDQLSRIQNGTDIFSWSLEREIDRYGNQIAYTYEKRGELPLVISIDYNVR